MGKFYSLLLFKIFSAAGNHFRKSTAFYSHPSSGVKQEVISKKLLAVDFDLKRVRSKLVFSSGTAEITLAVLRTLSSLISGVYLSLFLGPYYRREQNCRCFFPSPNRLLKQEQSMLIKESMSILLVSDKY